MVSSDLLTVQAAAARLGVAVPTLYDWLGQSDYGLLTIRGQAISIAYYQGGARGQGRIRIPVAEVDRLLEAMRVTTRPVRPPRRAPRVESFPGINVPLGRPDR